MKLSGFYHIDIMVIVLLILAISVPGVAGAVPVSGDLSAPVDSPGLLQFFAGGHMLGFAPGKVYLAGPDHGLAVDLIGSRGGGPQGQAAAADPGKGAPALGRVVYPAAWPGVDVVYTPTAEGVVESTYLLAAGADPASIRLRYNRPVELQADGSLRISFENGWMSESAPLAWQEIDGQRRMVDVDFEVTGKQEVVFALGRYDRAYSLIIDPTYIWHTFLGSAAGYDFGQSIDLDGGGNIYVAGWSSATWNGPGGIAPLNPYTGGEDIMVVKLAGDGTYLWHTFYGGAGVEEGTGIVVDTGGTSYITGYTTSTWNGPGATAPLHAYTGGRDIFVLSLTNAGAYRWHAFYGSAADNYGYGIALDGAGGVYIAGQGINTWNGPGPTLPLHAFSGFADITVLKLNTVGAYQWHTFYGSAGAEQARAITVDGAGNLYIAAESTNTWNGPGPTLPLNPIAGGQDAAVLSLTSAGAYRWHTFYGVAGATDSASTIAVDGSGGVYVGGISNGAWDGPGAVAPLHAYTGGFDMMVLKLNSAGAYQWHTFYGSAGFDFANGMAVDGGGTIFVTGYSPDTWNGPGATTPLYPFQGSSDIFVLRLTSAGAYQRHAFFGSSDNEAGYSVVTDAGGDAYVSGITYATSWDGPGPTAPLHAIGGNQDITVIRLDNDTTSPAVTGSDPANNVTIATGPSQIEVDFSEDVLHDAGGSAANSTANYLLVEDGTNAVFDTVSCLGGVQGDDVQQSITGIAYDNNDRAGPFAATLTLGTALLDGHYRLLVCGTTTIEDLAVNELNGGLADTPITFTVRAGAGGGGTELPEAGFAPGVVTILPSQPAARAYTDEQMWLEIPSLALKGSIVGVPHSEDGWDVTWLGDEIGWLTGTAFPTWDGNTGLVGHAYDAFGKPGPFAGLGSLKWGDQIIVHAWGQEHVYEVRMINNLVKPDDARLLNRHETLPWLTLVTCRGYDEKSDQYKYRTIVRAVLVKVSPETR